MSTEHRPADLIFPEARRPEAIGLGFCVAKPFGCGKPVTAFRDPLSRKEYGISGLCQSCQDSVFGQSAEEWEAAEALAEARAEVEELDRWYDDGWLESDYDDRNGDLY